MALSPKASDLHNNALRIGANISKRLTRLASKDVQGGDLLVTQLRERLEEIRAMPVTDYNKARTQEALMRRLDKTAGTRAVTFQKAARRAYRDALVEKVSHPDNVIRMTNAELAEAYAIQRSRLRDRVRRVKISINGSNFMIHRAENLLNESYSGATTNRLRSLVSATSKALSSQSLTPSGAIQQIERGVEFFGEIYRELNDEQRGALWKAMRREMELESISSPDANELIKTALESGKLQYKFIKSASSDELIGVIGKSVQEVEVRAKKMEIDQRNAMTIINNGREKWLGKGPVDDFWSSAPRTDYEF